MPKQKDLKRVIRARMEKTGESYTTARAQILKRKKTDGARKQTTSAEDYPRLAGMSNEAVKAKTGCDWERWVTTLDRMDAHTKPHREIAKLVLDRFDVSPWWAQTVTVGYERIKGLRDIGQRRGGTYEVNKTKTIGVPLETLYRAFSTKRQRQRWLGDHDITIRKANKNRSMRITWNDGTSLEVHFAAKGASKSRVTVQHVKLPTKAAAEEMKAFWGERLEALAGLLTAG